MRRMTKAEDRLKQVVYGEVSAGELNSPAEGMGLEEALPDMDQARPYGVEKR